MREADIKCKVAILLLLYNAYHTPLQAVLFVPTRRRKLAAETSFCCESNPCYCAFSAQTKQAKVKMTGENAQQKSLSG